MPAADLLVGGPHPEGAAAGHGLDGIDGQVLDDLAELALVNLGQPQVPGNVIPALYVRAA